MLAQHYPIIASSSRICWQVTVCARVDTGKENHDFVMLIIQNIPEQKYFVDIKHVTVTADSPDLSDFVTELAYSMLKSFTPQTHYYHWGWEYSCIYISGYLCRKVSRSACDQCKVILMPMINCIHLCLGSNIWIFKVWVFCSTSKLNTINWFKWTNFRKYTWTYST